MISPHCISAHIVRNSLEGPRYLLIRRCGEVLPGTWQMVTGGIEEGETASEAALREIQEETGLVPKFLYSAEIVETFYWHAKDKVAFVPVFVAFVDEESVRLCPDEHDAYEWLSFEEAVNRLVWQEQRRAMAHVHQFFVLQHPPSELLLLEIMHS